MWFSFKKFEGGVTGAVFGKVLRRTIFIFLIGLGLNAFPFSNSLGELRILGVLQRIALAYFMASMLCLWLGKRTLFTLTCFLPLIYWGILILFGGEDPYGLEANAVRQLDLYILGPAHLWKGNGIPFDPEGLLSTLPAVSTILAGYFTCAYIEKKQHVEAAKNLGIFGGALIGLGWLWGLVHPINKALWTGSYVLFTAGWALVFLAAVIYLIEVMGYRRLGQPFVIFGCNPLAVYVLSILWIKITLYWIHIPTKKGVESAYSWLFSQVFASLAGKLNGSLLFALVHVALFWCVALFLYRNKIFIKI